MSSKRDDMRTDIDRAPEVAELDVQERPDGPAAAAMLAPGVGLLTLGLLTVLSEASTAIHDWLESWEFGQGVGPLAGKTTVSVIVWALSWIVLAIGLRGRDVDLKIWFWVALVLGVLGFIGTFPPVFEAFASE